MSTDELEWHAAIVAQTKQRLECGIAYRMKHEIAECLISLRTETPDVRMAIDRLQGMARYFERLIGN